MKKLLYILTTIFALAAGNNAANANRWGFSTVQAGAAGQWGAKYLGGLIINGAHITSPVLQGAVAGITGGAIGGYVAEFAGGFMMTGDLSAANKAGLNGALVGGISGSVSAYRYAIKNDINPWTGKELNTKHLYNINNKGSDIVGTAFNEILPTQEYIDPNQVEIYKSMLQKGESIPTIETYRSNNGKIYIQDGHHRYVAYKALGLEPKIVIYNTGGPIGYPNWLNTVYEVNPYNY